MALQDSTAIIISRKKSERKENIQKNGTSAIRVKNVFLELPLLIQEIMNTKANFFHETLFLGEKLGC